MESPMGFVAVFAVSGSVVLLAHRLHKRLLSDLFEKIESELAGSDNILKQQAKKRVRFADDVVDPSSNNKEYRRSGRRSTKAAGEGEGHGRVVKAHSNPMPLNRQILYKGILEYKCHKASMY